MTSAWQSQPYRVQQPHILNSRVASAQHSTKGALNRICSRYDIHICGINQSEAVLHEQPGRAPLAQVGRDAMRCVADQDDRRAH